jgi:NADH dehydrogenase [ubiquinone] 1 alpha subcomplex assembly factor 7
MSDHAEDLGAVIDAEIRASGPMPVATYMALCLTHPTRGYYRTRDPLGAEGDFITAPEISQMFGEMVGAFVAGCWQALDRPAAFDLVELGPGRGTLMADLLRAATLVEGFREAVRPVLVETSEPLRRAQEKRLSSFAPRWLDAVDALEAEGPPIILIANEFFDALPIRQYQKSGDAWHERLIGLVDDTRAWGLSPLALPADAVPETVRSAEEGSVWETSPAAAEIMTSLSDRICARTGVALAIDYGYAETQPGETFQSVGQHRHADPLAQPGKTDLTAHVDFEALAGAARGAGGVPHALLTQAQFLAAIGIVPRAKTLATANPSMADSITADLKRLTGHDEMGTLFKVLCVSSPGLSIYPFHL